MTEAFVQENQNKMMIYARSPSLGLTVWLVSGSGAAPRAAAEALVAMEIDGASTGNRDTGLAPGGYRIGGGLKYLGVQLTGAEIDIDVTAVTDSALTINIFDWFDTRRGYYAAQSVCVTSGLCMTEAFVQENQNKMMIYARSPSLGLTVWLVSGIGAAPRSALLEAGSTEAVEEAGPHPA